MKLYTGKFIEVKSSTTNKLDEEFTRRLYQVAKDYGNGIIHITDVITKDRFEVYKDNIKL